MLFAQVFQSVGIADIQELCDIGYPETDLIELKQYVPGKSGPDRWHEGSEKIGDYARDELLSHLVAFANSRGGHLIVGVEESSTSPKRAVALCAIPSCQELADRLRQAAFASIEPPLDDLQVKGVPMGDDGAGVLLFRVGESRNAPHRLRTTMECYVRRGDATQRLTMREIQSLTINVGRGLERVDRRFREFSDPFESREVPDPSAEMRTERFGLRVSAVPLHELRLDKRSVDTILRSRRFEFGVTRATGTKERVSFPLLGFTGEPILRGFRIYSKDSQHVYSHSAFEDGAQSFTFVQHEQIGAGPKMSVAEILSAVLCVLDLATKLATANLQPGCEFAIEVHLKAQVNPINLFLTTQMKPSRRLTSKELLLPRYSFVPDFGMAEVVSVLHEDLFNCVGLEHGNPIALVE